MIKRKITETVEEYDDYGDLVKRTITETEETDDAMMATTTTSAPYMPPAFPCYGMDWVNLERTNGRKGCAE